MQATLTVNPAAYQTSEGNKALILLDLAASHAQAMVRPSQNAGFRKISFESSVMPVAQADGNSIQIETSNNNYQLVRVGKAGDRIEEFRTGATNTGKADNAKALLFHAIRSTVALTEADTFHCEVVFTTPHDAVFGPQISELLTGLHQFSVPAPSGNVLGIKDKHYRVHVHGAYSEMEGLRASFLIPSETWQKSDEAILFDVGSLTGLTYCVNSAGFVVDNQWKSIPNRGVHAIAEQVIQRGLLADRIEALSSVHGVIDTLFYGVNNDKTSHNNKVSKALKPIYADNFAQMIATAEQYSPNAPRFVVGGGANLPGVAEALGATVLGSDPQWAAMEGTLLVIEPLLAAKRAEAATEGE